MVGSDIKQSLPLGTELPDSDDIPVDNEEQNLLPNILLFILNTLWAERDNWFFGVDMGIYHPTAVNPRVPIVPDAFLSLGVERFKGDKLRRSYVVWEEDNIVPALTIEIVSWTPGGEYTQKMRIYREMGVLYYLIYNPQHWQRDNQQPFELYKLIEGSYQLQIGEPFWMPEIGLGIGRHPGNISGKPQEVLSWFDEENRRILSSEERAERLAARLRELGEDPDLV